MKKEFAFDKRFIFYIILGGMFLLIAALSIGALISEFMWEILLIPVVLLGYGLYLLINALFFIPCGYTFDKKAITVYYALSSNEYILWNDVYEIEVDYSAGVTGRYGRYLFTHEYVLSYLDKNDNSKCCENIRKSRKIKRMIEKYWDGQVSGYASDAVRKWFGKLKKKQDSAKKQYLTDEIAPMERQARAEMREFAKLSNAVCEKEGLVLRIEYRYMTHDGEKYSSRPVDSYRYVAEAQLIHKNELDDPRRVLLITDLLYVRAGKKSYRGTKNTTAIAELEAQIDETLSEIKEIGFDEFCDRNAIYFDSMYED